MIDIYTRNSNGSGGLRRKYERIESGPFPVTPEEWDKCVREYQDWKDSRPENELCHGHRAAIIDPIVRKNCPGLRHDIDIVVVASAIGYDGPKKIEEAK